MGDRGTKPQLINDQQTEAGQIPLQVEQASLVPGLHQLVDEGGGGDEAHRHAPLAGGQTQSQRHMGLAGAAVADGDDVLPALDVFTSGQFHHQSLVQRRYGWEVEGVQTLHRGEAGGADPALHHALVAVYELKLGKTEQVLGVIHTLGGALRSLLPVINDNKECAAKVGLLLIFVRLRFTDSVPSRDGQRFSPLRTTRRPSFTCGGVSEKSYKLWCCR